MKSIASLDDLKRLKAERRKKLEKAPPGSIQVMVGMGTCGIAAGARVTLQAFLDLVGTRPGHQDEILLTQTGCLGLCEFEPVVQVLVSGQPGVIYGRVTPEAAVRIFNGHLMGGQILPEYVIGEEYFAASAYLAASV